VSSFVFIDLRVSDIDRLLAGLAGDIQVVILDSSQDGIVQIAEALAGAANLDSIHIISHGSSGTLYLGSTVLTEDNLNDYEDELALIGASLSDEGDILLYGCNVGADAIGESFIASLADYTGADVAASDDVTGSSLLGGDWVLEANSGMIESKLVLTAAADFFIIA
jgi:hypothetical protein